MTADQHLYADVLLHRPEGKKDRDRRRADPHAGRQHAEAAGADVEDVAGVDRQQRGRAGKQHHEQVERDGREHQPVVADVAETLDDPGEDAVVLLRGGCGTWPIRKIMPSATTNSPVMTA